MPTLLISLVFLLFSSLLYGQTATPLHINYKRIGGVYAQSAVVDTTAFGGFGGSHNAPKTIKKQFSDQEGIFLWIDNQQLASPKGKTQQYHLYLGNKSTTALQLIALDSRLSVIAEVYYKGEWQAIEYLLSSWCGNSYHKVFLSPNQYWAFRVPKFEGKITTKLRYRLSLSNGNFLYSNEIPTSFNVGQLQQEEAYQSKGLMDPYED